jgi:hypothetical protein
LQKTQKPFTLTLIITTGASIDAINDVIPENDPLSVYRYNSTFVSFARSAIAADNVDPCSNENLEGLEFLCQALQENDLIATLNNVTYPVDVCHSPDDELVHFENAPDFDANPFVSYVAASGSHNDAGGSCILTAMLFGVGVDFVTFEPPALHSEGGCVGQSPAPTFMPSSAMPTSSAMPLLSMGALDYSFLLPIVLFLSCLR